MIDSHLHLQLCVAEEPEEPLMRQLRELGVSRLMVNATSPEDWGAVGDLALRHREVIPSFGIHPWKVSGIETGWEEKLETLLETFPGACVGEIGLDKWIADYDLPLQREFFRRQLQIAERWKRPTSIHCLRAWGSLLDSFDESSYDQPCLLHSFSGPVEVVNDWVERNAYFSISGYFFRPDKVKKLKVFESIPPERILLETDAPDMAFEKGGERYASPGLDNHPGNIELVYERFSEWAGESPDETALRMETNFARFLGESSLG